MNKIITKIKFFGESEYKEVHKTCKMCGANLKTNNVRILPDDSGGNAMFICNKIECFEKYIIRIEGGSIFLKKA